MRKTNPKPNGPKARQSQQFCRRTVVLRLNSNLHSILVRDAENKNVSTNTLLLRILKHLYEEELKMTETDHWKRALTYIQKTVKGINAETGDEVEGLCYGVDTQLRPMGPRGIFLVLKTPKGSVKINFTTLRT